MLVLYISKLDPWILCSNPWRVSCASSDSETGKESSKKLSCFERERTKLIYGLGEINESGKKSSLEKKEREILSPVWVKQQ